MVRKKVKRTGLDIIKEMDSKYRFIIVCTYTPESEYSFMDNFYPDEDGEKCHWCSLPAGAIDFDWKTANLISGYILATWFYHKVYVFRRTFVDDKIKIESTVEYSRNSDFEILCRMLTLFVDIDEEITYPQYCKFVTDNEDIIKKVCKTGELRFSSSEVSRLKESKRLNK